MRLVLLVLLGSGLPPQTQQANQEPPLGLESIYEVGPLLQDRNDDGHADFVAGHIVLGPEPSDYDVAAAANVAARLGFETSAMNLPITVATDGIPIAVGQAAMTALGMSPTSLGVDLEPGRGVVTVVDSAASPTLVIAGGDDAGTWGAALAFAARAPHVWDPDGPTFSDVLSATDEVLTAEQIGGAAARVTRFLVDGEGPGLYRLDVEIRVPQEALAQAEAALRRVAEGGEEGGEGEGGEEEGAGGTGEAEGAEAVESRGIRDCGSHRVEELK